MNDYENTKLNIFESFDNGYITESEKYELLYLLEDYYDSVYTEVKSRDEYARDKFKKKYNFTPDPNDKYGYHGTITANGKIIPVNISKNKYVNNKFNEVRKKDVKQMTDDDKKKILKKPMKVLNDDNNTIMIDNDFFKVKNQKRRDALLYHELTHRNMQWPSSDSDKQVPEIRDRLVDQTMKLASSGGLKIPRSLATDAVNKTILKNKKYDSKNKDRSDALNSLDTTHKSSKNYHIDSLEKEADMGGSKATSSKGMIKGLSDYYKNLKKSRDKDSSIDISSKKETNSKSKEDFDKRAQSLKENISKNIKYYNDNLPKHPGK